MTGKVNSKTSIMSLSNLKIQFNKGVWFNCPAIDFLPNSISEVQDSEHRMTDAPFDKHTKSSCT